MKSMGWIRLLALAVFCAGVWGTVEAQELPADVMPLSEVKAGMKGEAFSAVHGYKLERYDVEILGIERGGLAGSAMILALVQGPSIEQHGIVAGMSGSPVYIDGKIIGALAYGFQFAYKGIAGITPIEAMLPVLDLLEKEPVEAAGTNEGAARADGAAASAGWDWQPEWEAYSGFAPMPGMGEPMELEPSSPGVVAALGGEPLRMVPLSTPFYVSGLSAPSGSELKSFFDARGLTLMPMGSSAGSNEDPDESAPEMVGGSAIAIPVMSGDLTVAAIGTATYRRGDKIVAFGHPAFMRGSLNAPMAQAYMIAYMQSYALSFKLGESREVIGAIRQDKQFGVGGVFGEAPPRIEMTVDVRGAAAHPARPYRFKIWKDRDFGPMFTMIGLIESMSAAVGSGGELTGDVTYRIHLADGREIVKSDRSTAKGGLPAVFAGPLMQDMFLLMNNPFRQADVASIEVGVEVREGYERDVLLNAEPLYARLASGEKLEVKTRWRRHRGAEYEKTIGVDLPADLRAGRYVVHLADAATSQRVDTMHNRGRFRPRNFEQVVEAVQALEYPENRLMAYVFEPELGMSLQGETVEGIPGSIEGVLTQSAPQNIADPVVGRLIQSESVEFEAPVFGRATFLIEVTPHLPR